MRFPLEVAQHRLLFYSPPRPTEIETIVKNRIIEIAVTDLATKLDEARIAANDIEETAPQSGVYGDISDAMRKTLAVLLDGDHVRADAVYQALLDGATVREALTIEAKAHADESAADD